MADGDRVVVAADEDVLDEELQDSRLFAGVHVVQAVGQAAREALEGVGKLEVARGVVEFGFDSVALGAQRGLAAAELGHTGT